VGSRRSRADARSLALAYLGVQSIADVRLARVVNSHVERVIDAADGNLTVAAELLDVNRRSLQRRNRRQAVHHG
jgi:ActR/RegA family two-component response regulator